MPMRTGMFIVMLALLQASGCAQRYVLKMSNPEQSTKVILFEGGSADTEDDDRQTVLDEPERIAKVVAFFKSKEDEFYRLETDSPRMPRCTIVFRKDAEEKDRFWLDPEHLYMQSLGGDYFACKITQNESAGLINIFRSATEFKSNE